MIHMTNVHGAHRRQNMRTGSGALRLTARYACELARATVKNRLLWALIAVEALLVCLSLAMPPGQWVPTPFNRADALAGASLAIEGAQSTEAILSRLSEEGRPLSAADRDALEDARATMHCFRAMLEDEAEGGYLWVVERYRQGREKSARAMAQMEAERREAEERRRAELEERRTREKYERSPRGVAERAVASGEAKLVSKTTYVCLAVLLGWIGAHEFYAGRTARGILDVIFCWTFVPWIVAIVQAIRVAREETVEPGRVLIWKKAKRG